MPTIPTYITVEIPLGEGYTHPQVETPPPGIFTNRGTPDFFGTPVSNVSSFAFMSSNLFVSVEVPSGRAVYRFDDPDWTKITSPEKSPNILLVYGGVLFTGSYGSSSGDARVYRYDSSGNSWSQVGNNLSTNVSVYSMVEFDCADAGMGFRTIYVGTAPSGEVYYLGHDEYGDLIWISAGRLGTEVSVISLVVMGGVLYGSGDKGKVYKWDGGTTWTEISPYDYYGQYLAVLNGELYGVAGCSGIFPTTIMKYSGGTDWTQIGGYLEEPWYAPSKIAVYRDDIYVSVQATETLTKIYKFDGQSWVFVQAFSSAVNVLQVENDILWAGLEDGSIWSYEEVIPEPSKSRDVGLMQINDLRYPDYAGGTDPGANIAYATEKLAEYKKYYSSIDNPNDKKIQDLSVGAFVWNKDEVDKLYLKYGEDWLDYAPKDLQDICNQVGAYTEEFGSILNFSASPIDKIMEKDLVVPKVAGENTTFNEQCESVYMKQGIIMNKILVAWFLHNPLLLEGSMTIRGTTKAKIGTYCIDNDMGMEFYVENVSHVWRLFDTYVTTLTLTRGQPLDGGLYAHGHRGKFYFDEAEEEIPTMRIFPQPTAVPSKILPPPTAVPSKSLFVLLPSGPGYYFYDSPEIKYGTPQTIKAIQSMGATWVKLHPSGPRIGVGDISLQQAGRVPGHKAHKDGIEVDFRPMRSDFKEIACTYTDTTYSRALTQEFVNINSDNTVKVRFFNDSNIKGVTPLSGHSDHLHITFKGAGGGSSGDG
jgi:hypothetical protein